jgi:hypothetical protein
MKSALLFFQWLGEALPWLAPLAVSTVAGGVAGYGSFRFHSGAQAVRMSTIERDIAEARAEHAGLVTRNEFELLHEDLRDIKTDIREIRRSLQK